MSFYQCSYCGGTDHIPYKCRYRIKYDLLFRSSSSPDIDNSDNSDNNGNNHKNGCNNVMQNKNKKNDFDNYFYEDFNKTQDGGTNTQITQTTQTPQNTMHNLTDLTNSYSSNDSSYSNDDNDHTKSSYSNDPIKSSNNDHNYNETVDNYSDRNRLFSIANIEKAEKEKLKTSVVGRKETYREIKNRLKKQITEKGYNKNLCYSFEINGKCRFGKFCKFDHIQ